MCVLTKWCLALSLSVEILVSRGPEVAADAWPIGEAPRPERSVLRAGPGWGGVEGCAPGPGDPQAAGEGRGEAAPGEGQGRGAGSREALT